MLQISRSVIDGGFDYHREISQAYAGGDFEVTTVFIRGTLSPERVSGYFGDVHCLNARQRRIFKDPTAVLLWLLVLSRGRRFDLVICHHHTPAVIVNRLRRVLDFRRMYCLVHDFDYYNPADAHGRRRHAYVAKHLDKRCRFIAVSQAIRRNLFETMPFLEKDRSLTIHNAIDVGQIQRGRVEKPYARQELDIPTGEFVFGTVGRLVPFKAHIELIESFAQAAPSMPDSRLVIIGRGPLQERLEQRVLQLGMSDRIQILGFVPDASRLMSAFDVFVLPSHNEPFGLVLLEAMACRLPVIANNTGAVPEILPYEEGIADINQTEEFANALRSFFGLTDEQRQGMGELGLAHTQRFFGLERYRNDFRDLWDS